MDNWSFRSDGLKETSSPALESSSGGVSRERFFGVRVILRGFATGGEGSEVGVVWRDKRGFGTGGGIVSSVSSSTGIDSSGLDAGSGKMFVLCGSGESSLDLTTNWAGTPWLSDCVGVEETQSGVRKYSSSDGDGV